MSDGKISIFTKADLDMGTYLRKVLLPYMAISAAIFLAVGVITTFLYMPTALKVLMFLIPVVLLVYAAAYPYIVADSKRISINSKMPYFITYFAVLSTSEMARADLIAVLSHDPKLGAIADELKKVHTIVNRLHLSMPEAFRFLARRTPSTMFADFLDRLAYSLDSGVDLKDYLFQEQQTVMDDYQTFYEGALYDLDIFKEIYESIIISVVFIASFVIIGPIITGMDIATMGLYAVTMILAAEVGILLVVKFRMPEDPIWADRRGIEDPRRKRIKMAAIYSVFGSIIVALLYLAVLRPRYSIPEPFILAGVLTPFFYLGHVVNREEGSIFRKDENFPAFIRSMGSSLAASGASLVLVLKYLSAHDFGSLTQDIRALYRRLAVRVDRDRAWDFFIAGTGSWLIGIFSEIFRESLRMGAEPDYVGLIISRNFERLVRLRRKRQQSIASFVGIIYGLTGAFAFALAASFQVAVSISQMFSQMEVPTEYIGDIIHVISPSGMRFLVYLMLVMMVLHSLLSGLVIKLADGGHILGTVRYFVILSWIFAVGMYLGQTLMARMMGISSGGETAQIAFHLLGVIP
ncbi:archaellar assembly protein FlaJ [Thermococcus sp. GR7]|uniref:archaellar assembly protein FlaJ n=1 Tax=unclassified Thermococcus TaxID=2627626 RepID=UPI00142FB81C|nr:MULTISPECIES: archaellar assembly protein FlaJ [unclassified Thermococcus]NJE47507.1 archaellar assembly protein FlaJ [Thermococcus sp. GR7]NJE78565.1 archaellar assembly protein FlaJ [Thermococcus sp. GR4]NJF23557.1 archaellar assembly protein FlaJ [Thermococcus sp. GR5]